MEKTVKTIEPQDMSQFWPEFLRLTEGQEWRYTPAEQAWLMAARELLGNPSWFLQAVENAEE